MALGLAACSACSGAAETPIVDSEHLTQIETWRAERDQSLRRSDGWLTLVGLDWLAEGENPFGTSDGNEIVFPTGTIAESAGVFRRSGREVTLIPSPQANLAVEGSPVDGPLSLALDTAEGGPTVVESGSLTFYGIERGEMIGIRVKDSQSEVLGSFDGMDYFPVEPTWRKVGRYELFAEPRILRTPNILGTTSEEEIQGEVVFEVDGREVRLQPSGDPAEGFFLVFGDRTNGVETYGGGRFLYSEPVGADGTVVVDFNQAYCPPCVFTPYATCPLPPRGNKLAFRVEAGEKMFGAAH